jgi:hypothetical protein
MNRSLIRFGRENPGDSSGDIQNRIPHKPRQVECLFLDSFFSDQFPDSSRYSSSARLALKCRSRVCALPRGPISLSSSGISSSTVPEAGVDVFDDVAASAQIHASPPVRIGEIEMLEVVDPDPLKLSGRRANGNPRVVGVSCQESGAMFHR